MARSVALTIESFSQLEAAATLLLAVIRLSRTVGAPSRCEIINPRVAPLAESPSAGASPEGRIAVGRMSRRSFSTELFRDLLTSRSLSRQKVRGGQDLRMEQADYFAIEE